MFRMPTRITRNPISPYPRPSRPQVWNHNFLCLASRMCMHVPKREDKDTLLAAGLGERRISLGLNSSAQQLQEKLFTEFPKLRNVRGGYDLLRCLPNSRCLSRLAPPTEGFTPAYLKGQVGAARIYIRPTQDIPLYEKQVSRRSTLCSVSYTMPFEQRVPPSFHFGYTVVGSSALWGDLAF